MNAEMVNSDVERLLGNRGCRYTSGRRRVVEALTEASRPATISELAELDVRLSRSSLYRNLDILVRVGAVARVIVLDDHVRYALAPELTRHPHRHLICASCGVVGEFELVTEAESALRGAVARAGESAQFTIDTCQLDLLGTCSVCP